MIQRSLCIFVLLLSLFACSTPNKSTPSNADKNTPLLMWLEQPAIKWNHGLPIGNGRLGSMIYGTPAKQILGLNEDTIWSGEKHYDRDRKNGHLHLDKIRTMLLDGKYKAAEKLVEENLLNERLPSGSHSYQMLANLFIERPEMVDVKNYKRQLDLNTAVYANQFEKNAVIYTTEAFSSATEQVMLFKYSADKVGKVNLAASIKRTNNTQISISNNIISFAEHIGNGVGVKFHAIIHFELAGGESKVVNNKLIITNADEVIIRVVAASDYREVDPLKTSQKHLTKALSLSYEELKTRHIQDYQSFFNRVALKLGDENYTDEEWKDIPTDLRLERVKAGKADPYLTQLQYQLGRYLLISSSRPNSMPANLQGLWADGLKPAWNSDYHININAQMNYWMAEMTNLAELHKPFLKYIGDLREMGRITAKETYNSKGFVAHHTSDAWHATGANGKSRYGMWPMGAAWASQHLYTHYQYTEDKKYLQEYAYPVMKESAEFFLDYMVKNPKTGWLVTSPSVSPENNFISASGEVGTLDVSPTMDRAILFELFNNCIKASEILDIDEGFRKALNTTIKQIQPLQIGSDGRLMEWSEEKKERNPGHRHISHLYALHPSNQISKIKTPKLFKAARKTIDERLAHGGGHTSWSRAWIINFYARLLAPEKAHENVVALQKKSTLPNLLTIHPPFQIDGNLGLVSGITEMLMQSHAGELSILPALPKKWHTGFITGIVARKGFELDIYWENGELQRLVIRSKLGNTLKLRYGDEVKTMNTTKDQIIKLNSDLVNISP